MYPHVSKFDLFLF